jgi:nitrite reductase/ring-hydroxylating ferredoxin subunit
MQAKIHRLCRLDELPDGEARGFDPLGGGQDSVLLVRQGRQVYAYRDLCPHYGDTPMAWRRHAYLNAARSHIVCAAHGALFNIADGVCVRGPCLGQALTAVRVDIASDATGAGDADMIVLHLWPAASSS